MKEINLIGSSISKTLDLERIARKIAPFSFGTSIFSIVLAIIAIAAFLFLGNLSKTNVTKINNYKNEIQKLSKNESLLVTIDDRVGLISSIMKTVLTKAQIFSDLKIIFVPGLELNSFSLGATGNVEIEAKCSDNQCLTNLNERLEDLKSQGKFSSIILPTVQKAKDSSYSVGIQIKK